MTPDRQSNDEHWVHWYDIVEEGESLRQGDILRDLEAFVFKNEVVQVLAGEDVDVPVEVLPPRDWVILSASCDLDARGAENVLLAPVFAVTPEVLRTPNVKEFRKRLEVLRKGLLPRQFLLARHPELDFPMSFAHFEDLVFLPTKYIQSKLPGRRLRLKHPFREMFGNWVGARMSTVGPEDQATIPGNGERIFPAHMLTALEALDGDWDE